MKRFDLSSALIHGVGAAAAGGGLAALVLAHPGLPDWAAVFPAGGAVVWWCLGNRRYLRRLVAPTEPSDGIRQVLEERVTFYQKLDEAEQRRFRREIAWFLQEQTIEGVGVELDDVLEGLVAASAVQLTFGLPAYEWQTHRHILIYADAFDEDYDVGHRGDRAGVVHRQGSIIFSAKSLRGGFNRSTDGHNVGLHEFAHVLDLDDGAIDGVPAHLAFGTMKPWLDAMGEEMDKRGRRKRVLRDYGYTNAPEFFAVSTEMFFEKPQKLRDKAPELYASLSRFYGQDPAGDEPERRPVRRRRRRR